MSTLALEHASTIVPKHNLISKFSSYDALCHHAQWADYAALSGMLTIGVSSVKYLKLVTVCLGVCACVHVCFVCLCLGVCACVHVCLVCVCACVLVQVRDMYVCMYVCAWCRCVNATNKACPTI